METKNCYDEKNEKEERIVAKKRSKQTNGKKLLTMLLVLVLAAGYYIYQSTQVESYPMEEIPAYSGEAFVYLNGNRPEFSAEALDLAAEGAYESYSELDWLGRCGVAEACVGRELMPTAPRESISSVKPTGWEQEFYDFVDGEALYNRCHLIGFQLTGENANEQNLMTGTRYMNVDGMLPFEDLIADYVHDTGNHVLYRVTPAFQGTELLARGVQLEGWSVEDGGRDVCFNVFCYNVQPGVELDYSTGENWLAEGAA